MVKNIEGKSFNFLAQVPSPMFVAHESITNKVVNYKNNRKVILKRTKRKSPASVRVATNRSLRIVLELNKRVT